MNETKQESTQKICPIFGSHSTNIAGNIKAVIPQQLLGQQYQMMLCIRSKCEFWDTSRVACSLSWPHHSFQEAANALYELGTAIRDLVELMKKTGGT